jgi:hypothetical protein
MQEANYREGIARVRAEFKLQSADSLENLPNRSILSELQSTTITFICQRTDKRQLWNSPNLFTILPCLKLIQVPVASCCDYDADCTIARSAVQLPKIAEGTNFGMLIQGLYSIDGVSRRFIESTPDRFANSLKLGLTTKQIQFFLQDRYLYVGDDKIERVKLSAYFEEDIPQDLISYPAYCGGTLSVGCCPDSNQTQLLTGDMSACCPVNPYDALWKIPAKLVDPVIKEVANKLLNTYKRSQADNTSDMLDTTK